jgi:hypothetical protein
MFKNRNSFKQKPLDPATKQAIDMTTDLLKMKPTKFKAVYSDGRVVMFDAYKRTMTYHSKDGKTKNLAI